jgi:outer membrane protein insertion porin family
MLKKQTRGFQLKLSGVLLILALLALPAFSQAEQTEEPLVNFIEISGAKKIEEGTIRTRITQKVNEPLSRDKVLSDIKEIYKMGYFEDVRIETAFFEGGLKLTYVVKEKPVVAKINYHGNDNFDDEKLKTKSTLITGSIADPSLIQDNAQSLKKFYDEQGYYLSEIYPVVKYTSENEAAVTFEIKEGNKIRIKEIKINGNKNISDRKIKKALKTSTWWIFSFITDGGYVKKDDLQADIQLLADLYLNEGYLKITVGEPKVSFTDDDKSGIIVTYDISEGYRYKVSEVAVRGYQVFPSDQIEPILKMKKGEYFSRKILTGDMTAISDFYTERGYATVSVTPDLQPNDEDKTVKVVDTILEGKIYRIGRIEITGNSTTKDKVIRREVKLDEGEMFDSRKIKRSSQKLKNLDFFETVDITPRPKPEEEIVDLDVKVKEKSTGFVSLGGGYSSVDRLMGMVQFTKNNLFGGGQYLRVSGQLGSLSHLYDITYREPYLFDRPISLTTSIYNTERIYSAYTRDANGAAVGLGREFAEYWAVNATYTFELVKVFDIASGVSSIITDQAGKATTSSITPSLVRDSRDNYIDPTTGSRNSVYTTYAGLGGTNYFLRSEADSLWFFPFVLDTTLSMRGRVGYATGLFSHNLPLYEKFYLGSISTIRGISLGKAGPQDQYNTPIGGSKEVIFNGEFIFPIIPEIKLKGVIFSDSGNSWDDSLDSLRYTAGAGLRWISPFGPVRVEYGRIVSSKDPGEAAGKVEFSFGTSF